jgi:hypothetical protein
MRKLKKMQNFKSKVGSFLLQHKFYSVDEYVLHN